MAFGGNMGAGNALTPVGVFQSPLIDAPAAQNAYVLDPATNLATALLYRDAAGSGLGGGAQKRLHTLMFLMTNNGSPSTPVLSAFANATLDGSAADTGILLAAQVVGANQHQIPSNFGSVSWGLHDLPRLSIEVQAQRIDVPAATSNLIIPIIVVSTGGALLITFKNTSAQAISSLNVRLRYDHTLVF